MTSLLQNPFTYNHKVEINFDGGNLTPDAGLLLYREFDEIIGFLQHLNDYLDIKDSRIHKTHSKESMILQKISDYCRVQFR